MVSRQYKELVKAIKKTGWTVWDVPMYITVDKNTLEPKPTAKNMTAYELAQMVGKLPDKELDVFHFKNRRKESPLKTAMLNYAESQLQKERHIVRNIADLYRDYNSKVKNLEAKKARAEKKREKEMAKQKLIQSLDRKDIAKTISNIRKSMEPYIRKQEKNIQTTFKNKEKELMTEWRGIYKDLQQNGFAKDRAYSGKRSPESILMFGKLKTDDGVIKVKEFVRINYRSFMRNWFDRKEYALKPSAKYILNGQTEHLVEQVQKQFRQNEELKVEILFYRLMRNNPTLRNYELTVPYNGNEFTLSAENENREEIIIQTNTIQAGGYNIQRLHTRWLVDIRNTVTGKKEKFTIDDKTMKK